MLKGDVKLRSRSNRSRQVGTLIVVVLISGFNLLYFDVASADITIDGETVHAETDGYVVEFDKGVITYIHNKLTDQTYTLSMPVGHRTDRRRTDYDANDDWDLLRCPLPL